MTEKEKMLAGERYDAGDPELAQSRIAAHKVTDAFNRGEGGIELLQSLFGKAGEDFYIEPTFRCDYGYNIEVGERFYANFDCIMLDICKITIGDNCLLGPRVSIFAASHPLEVELRAQGIEYGKPVTIGNNVWVGGGVIINPGVTIGDGVVIGAGSVVTKDLPPNVLAVGNPAAIIRRL